MNRLLLLVGVWLAATAATAQTAEDVLLLGQRQPAVGVRLTGLGGASIGGVADWGAAYTNPAGLGFLRRSEISGSLLNSTLTSDADVAGTFSDARTSRASLYHLSYAAKAPTARGSLVVGVGYHQTALYDRALAYEADLSSTFTETGDLFEEGQLGEVAFTGAMEIAPDVMAGVTANLLVGDYFYEGLFQFDNPTGIDEVNNRLEMDLRGTNLRGGIAARVPGGMRVGLMVETPSYLWIEETRGGDFDDEVFDYSIFTPWRFGAGVAYVQGGLLLAADAEFADWSQARLDADGVSFASANAYMRRSFREAVTSRFGAEYNTGIVAIRAGASFQPDPLRDERTANRTRATYSMGLSIAAGAARIDAAFVQTQFEDELSLDDDLFLREDVTRNAVIFGVTVGI